MDSGMNNATRTLHSRLLEALRWCPLYARQTLERTIRAVVRGEPCNELMNELRALVPELIQF